MGQKVLSISIAAYNVENFLKDTLQSLLLEEPYRSKLDIIIVNDGSKDRTLEITKQYADKYSECIRFIDKPNGGYGSTINASLAIAKGSYYKLLDGDDWFNQDGLKGLLDYLETASSDLVISPYFEETDKNGKDKKKKKKAKKEKKDDKKEEKAEGETKEPEQSQETK